MPGFMNSKYARNPTIFMYYVLRENIQRFNSKSRMSILFSFMKINEMDYIKKNLFRVVTFEENGKRLSHQVFQSTNSI